MRKFRVTVDLWSDNTGPMTLGSTGETLYDKWLKSQSDEDFEELAEWIVDDVSAELDFSITEVEELS
jgi:hypothetical protein